MKKWYSNWMIGWETRLTEQDTNRVVRPLEWGVEWTKHWPGVDGNHPDAASDYESFLHELNAKVIGDSHQFFSYTTPTDFRLVKDKVYRHATGDSKANSGGDAEDLGEGMFLRFTSPVVTPVAQNNEANARWFETKKRSDKAVIIVPQWNSDALSHNALGVIFNKLGISALRYSMPYHDRRRPDGIKRADYAVSANIGRTLDSTRQGVLEIRSMIDWLNQQGYTKIGIVGTSLGSCLAFLASAHDERLKVNIFNHASTYFADVVWTGQSTRHIRAGVEEHVDLERLRRSWMAISPMSYMDLYAKHPKKTLMIWAEYDLTFLPEFSQRAIEEFKRRSVDFRAIKMPCGHYTIGQSPYKFLDGWHISSFLHTAMKAI